MSFTQPEQRVGLLEFTDARACDDAALALAAQGFAFSVVELPPTIAGGRRWVLTVPGSQFEAARGELSAYVRELRERRVVDPAPEPVDSGVAGALGYGGALAIAYALDRMDTFGLGWSDRGMNWAGAVRDGEWWRTVTALFLHVDLPHVASNVFFGCLFGVLLAHSTGSGLAWLAILLAGALGNFVNDLFQEASHLSIGASTAVFAAVGLLVGVESLRRGRLSVGPAKRYGPILLGAVLLAWFGNGGGDVDIGAHVFGFASGLVASWPLHLLAERIDVRSLRVQSLAGAAAVLVAVLAWAVALVAGS
jgi:membrane associated rhomboid family serine protease